MIRPRSLACYGADMRSPLLRAIYIVPIVVFMSACASSEDGGESSSGPTTGEATVSASGTSSGATDTGDSVADAGSEETGDPVGHEYGPCPDGIGDCPEGILYACLTKITEGAVCAPECDTHEDCPPPPPGGSVVPVCTQVDGWNRCLLALCESDDDCPTGMSCHIEGPNWCHWAY